MPRPSSPQRAQSRWPESQVSARRLVFPAAFGIYRGAGYEKEMEEFIRSNPGLKSRIGYLIKFKDYNVDELMEIFNKLLEKNKLKIEDLAKETVRQVITDSSKIDNFGNGRFINNLFQNILIQSLILLLILLLFFLMFYFSYIPTSISLF